MTTTLQTVVEKNGNTLEVNCAAEVGFMHADMTKVRQVLFNFLSNAGKFTENGTVRLEVSRVNLDGREWVRFAVRDTGIGMTDEQMRSCSRTSRRSTRRPRASTAAPASGWPSAGATAK